MIMPKTVSMSVQSLLKKDRRETLEMLERINEMLIGLRYEGKVSFGKNVKRANIMLKFFDHELKKHSRFEEKILFPFVKSHLPKLESVIRFLEAEHKSFGKNLDRLSLLLKQKNVKDLSSHQGEWVEQVSEAGTYLIYLVRHHLETRGEGIDKVVEHELRHDEKKELRKRLIKLAFIRSSARLKI